MSIMRVAAGGGGNNETRWAGVAATVKLRRAALPQPRRPVPSSRNNSRGCGLKPATLAAC